MHSIAKEQLPHQAIITYAYAFLQYLNFIWLILKASSFDTKNLYFFYQMTFVVDIAVS